MTQCVQIIQNFVIGITDFALFVSSLVYLELKPKIIMLLGASYT